MVRFDPPAEPLAPDDSEPPPDADFEPQPDTVRTAAAHNATPPVANRRFIPSLHGFPEDTASHRAPPALADLLET
ncbi:hypothetical protein GCM10023147_00110 [Tsukamurella soli]|uniref:Uncharacterized protein n=1 Tax=Tsukamurella soli TaxID=644556 RepID=A0ABP8IZZ7_9ACTN